jgi:mono/diheme cytochrome c family protein
MMPIRRSMLAALAALAAGAMPVLAADGAAVFKAQCAKCHGETGQADTAAAKTLKVPPLAGDAKVAGMSDADVVAAVKANAKHAPVLKTLSEADLGAAAIHAKQLASGK